MSISIIEAIWTQGKGRVIFSNVHCHAFYYIVFSVFCQIRFPFQLYAKTLF